MKHEAVTQEIIGCAYRVYNELGYGFLESVYHKSMLLELGATGLLASTEHAIDVYYRNQIVGQFVADILVENEVVVELKSIRETALVHEVQLVNYLKALNKDVGLLLNFSEDGVKVKRKVRQLS